MTLILTHLALANDALRRVKGVGPNDVPFRIRYRRRTAVLCGLPALEGSQIEFRYRLSRHCVIFYLRLTMASFSSVFLLTRDRLCGGVVTITVASFFGETAFQGDSADRFFCHFNTLQRSLVSSASAGARGNND